MAQWIDYNTQIIKVTQKEIYHIHKFWQLVHAISIYHLIIHILQESIFYEVLTLWFLFLRLYQILTLSPWDLRWDPELLIFAIVILLWKGGSLHFPKMYYLNNDKPKVTLSNILFSNIHAFVLGYCLMTRLENEARSRVRSDGSNLTTEGIQIWVSWWRIGKSMEEVGYYSTGPYLMIFHG